MVLVMVSTVVVVLMVALRPPSLFVDLSFHQAMTTQRMMIMTTKKKEKVMLVFNGWRS
jgi:hypothetical protein